MPVEKCDVVIVVGSFGGLFAGKEAVERRLKTLILEPAESLATKCFPAAGCRPGFFTRCSGTGIVMDHG